jgi:hypothetical protein
VITRDDLQQFRKLVGLDIKEVSSVSRGANTRAKILLRKSEDTMPTSISKQFVDVMKNADLSCSKGELEIRQAARDRLKNMSAAEMITKMGGGAWPTGPNIHGGVGIDPENPHEESEHDADESGAFKAHRAQQQHFTRRVVALMRAGMGHDAASVHAMKELQLRKEIPLHQSPRPAYSTPRYGERTG